MRPKATGKMRNRKRGEYEHLLLISWGCKRLVDDQAAKLHSKLARNGARQLSGHLEEMSELISMPVRLLESMRGYAEGKIAYMAEFSRLRSKHGTAGVEELLRRLDEHFDAVQQERAKPKAAKDLAKEVRDDAFIVFSLASETAVRALLSAAMVSAWTAFESLATDLWVSALDNNARPLAQAVLASLDPDSEGGLSSRHIQVGLAAKHGFDLRHCLGTLLKPRFDFSSVSGIRDAYERAFGKLKKTENLRAEGLRLLEQTRNLIVHRGGIADAKFVSSTKLKVKLHSRIRVKPRQLGFFILAAAMAGFDLLNIVDDWIIGNQS